MTIHWKLGVGTLATVGVAALPASAGAVGAGTPISESPFKITTTTQFDPCYTTDELNGKDALQIALVGGTPGDKFGLDVDVAGQTAGESTGTFDVNGEDTVRLSDVVPKQFKYGVPVKGDKTTILVGEETSSGVVSQPVGSFLMTQSALEFSGYRLGGPASLSLSGMWADETNYIFVTNPAATKVLSEFKLPRANSCGYASGHGVFFHQTHEKVGTYHIFVYDKPTLNERQAWEYKLPVTNP